MEIDFLGVGEAFEPQLGNSSFIIKSQSWLMIDCGYGIPRLFFEQGYHFNAVDAIYLTHFHADHLFGLPILVNYWQKEGRTKPLTIIGQRGTKALTAHLFELAYPGMQAKLTYPLYVIESEDSLLFKEWTLQFAETNHNVKNMAVKIESNGIRIGISGDGDLTQASRQLFQDCHVMIHDAFQLNEASNGHATAESVVDFARSLPFLKILAFVHIHRKERQQKTGFLALSQGCSFELLIPEPGDILPLTF